MIQGGDYIVDSSSAFNKYLIGLVLNIFAVITLLLLVTSSIAWFWRLLDYPFVRDRLWLLGYDSDILVPFLPSIFLTICWFISWILAYYRKGSFAHGRAAEHLLFVVVASFLIATSLLFGNGDVRMPWDSEYDDPTAVPDKIWMTFVIAIAVVTLLIPVIRPQRLLRSAVAPRNIIDKWTFRTLSCAVLCGIPLILIGYFGREDYSGYFQFSERGLHESEIKFTRFIANVFRQTIPEATEQSFDPEDYFHRYWPQSQPKLNNLTDDETAARGNVQQATTTTKSPRRSRK